MVKDHVPILILAGMAALTGIFAGVSTWALGMVLEWSKPWAWGIGAWAISSAGAWLFLLRRWWVVLEEVLGIDLNRDGYIGQPVIIDPVTRVEVLDPGGMAGDYLDLPVTEEQFIKASLAVIEGAGFGHALSGPGQPLSRAEFENLRDYLIRRGYAQWVSRHHNQGVHITGKGRALMRAYASLAASDIPRLYDGKHD